MAIYRRGGIWWVDVYAGNPPKRIRKSTKTGDEQKARIIEQTILGVRKRTTPRQQAVSIIDALLPQEKAGVQLKDCAAFYDTCLADEGIVIARRTKTQRLNVLRAFCAWTADHAQAITVDDVTTEEAFVYSQELGKRGILGKSRNSYIGDLSTVWKMLVRRSKAKDNPWVNVRVQRDRENEHTGRAFRPDEVARILSVCREVGHDWHGMAMVALYTGLRMPDVANLRWDEIDLDARVIRKTPGKTARHGISVAVPIHARLLETLRTLPKSGEWVFPWRHGHPASYKFRGGDCPFGEILRRAGVVAERASDKLSFHCLRHTFVSRLAEAGVAEDVRMRLAGHTSAVTHGIYTHDDVSGRRAIDLLA